MKVGALTLVLLAASAGPSAFAKDGHHGHHAAKAAAHRGASAGNKGTIGKDTRDKGAADKIDVGGSEVPLPSRESGRNVKTPELQIVKPNNAVRPRVGVSVPLKPPVRNAIGEIAVPTGSVKAGGAQADADKTPQETGAVQSQGGFQRFNGAAGTASAKPVVRPGEGVAFSSRNTIGGTGLIRPTMVGTVGGPAKSGGINGTLLRAKQK